MPSAGSSPGPPFLVQLRHNASWEGADDGLSAQALMIQWETQVTRSWLLP